MKRARTRVSRVRGGSVLSSPALFIQSLFHSLIGHTTLDSSEVSSTRSTGSSWGYNIYHIPSPTMIYHTIPSCNILYYTIPSCNILYHTIPSCNILYHSIPLLSFLWQSMIQKKFKLSYVS